VRNDAHLIFITAITACFFSFLLHKSSHSLSQASKLSKGGITAGYPHFELTAKSIKIAPVRIFSFFDFLLLNQHCHSCACVASA
jgi:hypothetical protein